MCCYWSANVLSLCTKEMCVNEYVKLHLGIIKDPEMMYFESFLKVCVGVFQETRCRHITTR